MWLEQLGCPAPTESVVEAGITYVTRMFVQQPGLLDDLDVDLVGAKPGSTRGGVALRQEGGRWILTLTGYFGEVPPSDDDGFLAYARSLPTPGLAQLAEGAPPLSEPVVARYPASRWRRRDQLAGHPEGFLAIGTRCAPSTPSTGRG